MKFGNWMAALAAAAGLAVAAPVVSGSGQVGPGQAWAQSVLRVVPHADLTRLDPVFASTVITRQHGMMIYEQLFAWDSKLVARPQMVESWSSSADGLTWRFTLREGLAFHDGAPVTVADVIRSLQRWMARDLVGIKMSASVAGLKELDAKSFELSLKAPYPMLLFSLGSAIGQVPVIMRAVDIEDFGKSVDNAIGSGPFKFNHAERLSGARVVYDRNPAYRPRAEPPDGLAGGRLAKVDRVEWRIIPDAATAAAALQSGEVDLWEQPALDLLPVISRNAQIRLQKLTELSNMIMLRPNALHPPFDNPKARLALAYIVDQGDAMAAGFGDEKNWARCDAYYICGGPYGTEAGTADFKRTNLERARALLKEAGYNGERLVIPTTTEIGWMGRIAEVAADSMKKAGMNVELVWSDWGTVGTRLRSQAPVAQGGWSLFVTGASGPTMHHPLTNLGTNMACDKRNFAGWPCDEAAEALRQAFLDADDAGRAGALDKLHRHLAEVQPYRLLGQYDQPVAYRANVSGVLSSPVTIYWNIEKK